MQPRRSKAYYGLSPTGKVCFHTGMPLRQCQSEQSGFAFRNEKIGDNLLTSAEQKKTFESFAQALHDEPRVTIFCSQQTDEDALEAASFLLRNYVERGQANFLFVNQDDIPPHDPELVQDLYVLMGVHHEADCSWIRRWVRSRMGVPIWICLTAPKPVEWYQDRLGIKPAFLFSLKGTVRTSG